MRKKQEESEKMEAELKLMQQANEANAKQLQEKQNILKKQLTDNIGKAQTVEKEIHKVMGKPIEKEQPPKVEEKKKPEPAKA